MNFDYIINNLAMIGVAIFVIAMYMYASSIAFKNNPKSYRDKGYWFGDGGAPRRFPIRWQGHVLFILWLAIILFTYTYLQPLSQTGAGLSFVILILIGAFFFPKIRTPLSK